MKTYRYSKQFRSEHRKYTTLVFSIILLFVILRAVVVDIQDLLQNPIGGLTIILGLVANVVYDLYKINMYPNLAIGENGLRVEFLGFYVPVSWENLESVTLLQSSNYPEKFTEWFVRTKKLTVFHLLYGKFKYGDYVTGFVIRSELENVQQVLDQIGGKLPASRYPSLQGRERLKAE